MVAGPVELCARRTLTREFYFYGFKNSLGAVFLSCCIFAGGWEVGWAWLSMNAGAPPQSPPRRAVPAYLGEAERLDRVGRPPGSRWAVRQERPATGAVVLCSGSHVWSSLCLVPLKALVCQCPGGGPEGSYRSGVRLVWPLGCTKEAFWLQKPRFRKSRRHLCI